MFLGSIDSKSKKLGNEKDNNIEASTRRIALLILAITIHNIPEGLAVGVSFAAGNFAIARNTAIGIGIQDHYFIYYRL